MEREVPRTPAGLVDVAQRPQLFAGGGVEGFVGPAPGDDPRRGCLLPPPQQPVLQLQEALDESGRDNTTVLVLRVG